MTTTINALQPSVSVPLRGNGYETGFGVESLVEQTELFPSPCGEMGMKHAAEAFQLEQFYNKVSVPLRGNGYETFLIVKSI